MRIYQLVDGDKTYHFFRTKAEAKKAKAALTTIYRDLDADEKAQKLEVLKDQPTEVEVPTNKDKLLVWLFEHTKKVRVCDTPCQAKKPAE
jgi:hypothetical protein